MKKKLIWISVNGLFLASLYLGFVVGVDGFYRTSMFVAWVTILLSPFILHDDVVSKMRERGRPMPNAINIAFDLIVVGIFVWFGAVVTGSFYLVHMFIQEAAWTKAINKDKRGVI